MRHHHHATVDEVIVFHDDDKPGQQDYVFKGWSQDSVEPCDCDDVEDPFWEGLADEAQVPNQ